MKNTFINKDTNLETEISTKRRFIQQNFKPNTVNIDKLLNRVKIQEKNKRKENLILFALALIFISAVAYISLK
jgi:hypothetical protein